MSLKTFLHGIGTGVVSALKWIGHLFAADILPFAIEATEAWNEAVKSGEAQAIVNLLTQISPTAGHIGQDVLNEGAELGPKVLSAELGLQALESGATAEQEVAWAQSLLDAFGSASWIKQTKAWNSLATNLAILYDQGRQQNKTWMDWAQTVQAAFDKITEAAAEAKADAAQTADENTQP